MLASSLVSQIVIGNDDNAVDAELMEASRRQRAGESASVSDGDSAETRSAESHGAPISGVVKSRTVNQLIQRSRVPAASVGLSPITEIAEHMCQSSLGGDTPKRTRADLDAESGEYRLFGYIL